MAFILGLDVSTSCTGWCILDDDGKFIDLGSIKLSVYKSPYKKASVVRTALGELLIKYDIKNIYIEENLQAFRPGFSSAKTLSTLARFNGIVSLLCFETFNLEPEHLNVNAARKTLGIKLIRKKYGGKPTKEQVFEWVSDQIENDYSGYQWPIKTLKSGRRKGEMILDSSSYDMADAYVICRAGWYKLNIEDNVS